MLCLVDQIVPHIIMPFWISMNINGVEAKVVVFSRW